MYTTLHTDFFHKSWHIVDQHILYHKITECINRERTTYWEMKNPCKYQNDTSVRRAIDQSAYWISPAAIALTALGPHPKEQHPNTHKSHRAPSTPPKLPQPSHKKDPYILSTMHTTKIMQGDTWLSECHAETSVQVQHCPSHMTSVRITQFSFHTIPGNTECFYDTALLGRFQ
jgi:hypothetical protein